MAQASLERSFARPSTRRRPTLEAGVDRVWRFFTSVRMAAAEIALLAVLVLVGTLRGSSVPNSLAEVLPFTSGLVEGWYAWDVFGSLLFISLLTLIAVAITICTINRAPGIWTSIAKPTVATTHGFIRNAEISARFTPAPESEDVAATVVGGLRKSGYRVLQTERNGETHFYADKFHWARLATFPFHLALIMILIGGIVGSRWGFRDNAFIVPEGVTREVGHDTGVSIRVDNFTEQYDELGVPKEYRSDLTVLKGADPVTTGSITVNHPLTFGDMVVYQSGFGQGVHMAMQDAAGRSLMDDVMPLGPFQSQANPDAPAAVMDIPPAGVTLTVIGPDANPANQPELDQLNLRSGQMFVQIRPMPGSTAVADKIESVVNQGESVRLGPYDLSFIREKRFTVLQIARNPGIPIFFAASFLLVAGLALTFYFPHRRIRGILNFSPTGSPALAFAPLARRDWSGKQAFSRVMESMQPALGAATWTHRDPETLSQSPVQAPTSVVEVQSANPAALP